MNAEMSRSLRCRGDAVEYSLFTCSAGLATRKRLPCRDVELRHWRPADEVDYDLEVIGCRVHVWGQS